MVNQTKEKKNPLNFLWITKQVKKFIFIFLTFSFLPIFFLLYFSGTKHSLPLCSVASWIRHYIVGQYLQCYDWVECLSQSDIYVNFCFSQFYHPNKSKGDPYHSKFPEYFQKIVFENNFKNKSRLLPITKFH